MTPRLHMAPAALAHVSVTLKPGYSFKPTYSAIITFLSKLRMVRCPWQLLYTCKNL